MEIAGCRRCFTITRDAFGFWVARETAEKCIHGVFPTQREAIRFALIETTRAVAVAR
jgi:hypothetical protein